MGKNYCRGSNYRAAAGIAKAKVFAVHLSFVSEQQTVLSLSKPSSQSLFTILYLSLTCLKGPFCCNFPKVSKVNGTFKKNCHATFHFFPINSPPFTHVCERAADHFVTQSFFTILYLSLTCL
jgi:hypothetical protein